jgi:hypothetical protein
MGNTLEIIKNSLPYYQPYSIIFTDCGTNEKFVMGDYKTKQKAELALIFFESKYSGCIYPHGLEYFKSISKRQLTGKNQKPIDELEKRILNPSGDNHEIKSKNLKRKIILD